MWIALTGCYKNHLYVQQEWVNASFLASSHIGTPDPRSLNPPKGTRLLIGWNFPLCLFEGELILVATVRFWDNTEKVLVKKVQTRRGSTAFDFPNKENCMDLQILTYKIDVFSPNGTLLETWKHHFWVELIQLDVDKTVSAQSSHFSVSSHPKQGSVKEIP